MWPEPYRKTPDELRAFTQLLLAEVKSQAMLIEKLRHQLSGIAHIGLAANPRASSSCNWPWRAVRLQRQR